MSDIWQTVFLDYRLYFIILTDKVSGGKKNNHNNNNKQPTSTVTTILVLFLRQHMGSNRNSAQDFNTEQGFFLNLLTTEMVSKKDTCKIVSSGMP